VVMRTLKVVVAQSDQNVAQQLILALDRHVHFIYNARTLQEARDAIVKHQAHIAIVDTELAELSEVERLRRDFAGVCLVCTHRLADETMWTEAVEAGASDFYHACDVPGILGAILRAGSAVHRVAA